MALGTGAISRHLTSVVRKQDEEVWPNLWFALSSSQSPLPSFTNHEETRFSST